jgi:hypothetical protein
MSVRMTEFPEAKASSPAAPTGMTFVRLDDAARSMGAPSVGAMLDILDQIGPATARRLADSIWDRREAKT